jgi:hypothetical protein
MIAGQNEISNTRRATSVSEERHESYTSSMTNQQYRLKVISFQPLR